MAEEREDILQLPVSCLAEYVAKHGRSPESILRPYKFRTNGEGIARIVFRPPVITVIRKHYKLDRDPAVFESATAKWLETAGATEKKSQRGRLHSNINALALFRLRYGDREFEILSNHRISCQIGPVIFTASPDLWVKEKGQEYLIKIGFGKRKRSYVDVLLNVMRRAALLSGHRIRPRNAIYLDTYAGEELVSRFAFRDYAVTLTAAANAIAKIWPRVTPMETRTLPTGKDAGHGIHGSIYSSGN
jgi:hypothetical protein